MLSAQRSDVNFRALFAVLFTACQYCLNNVRRLQFTHCSLFARAFADLLYGSVSEILVWHRRAAKAQTGLRICADLSEHSMLTYTKYCCI